MLMPDVVDEALDNQKRNIGTRTGRTFEAWVAIARASSIAKHAALLAWLKAEHGVGHGDANLIALTARRPDPEPGESDVLATIYAGPKAGLRPFHERVVTLARSFGDDVTVSPKQAYVSLRRTRQFATVGPASGGRLELGLDLKNVTPEGRLEPATGMCTHRVRLLSPDDFDAEVQGWLREAYE